jgi:hypothetical protein
MLRSSYQALRREHQACVHDRNPRRFYEQVIPEVITARGLNDFSIKALFEEFVPDGAELVREFDPRQGGGFRIMEAIDAVDTSAFSNISGQLMYSAIMEKYQAPEFVFTKLIPTQPTSFNGEKIPGLGQIGDKAEVVGEGQQYPLVGFGEDWVETPLTTKRGMICPITKEAIFFDRTGQILDRGREVGYWLAVNKEIRAIDCVIDENTTAHRYKWRGTSYATYQTSTPWDNVTASNALVDWTDFDADRQTGNGLIDPNTGMPIVMAVQDVVVTDQLLWTANRLTSPGQMTVTVPGYATTGNPTQYTTSNPVTGLRVHSSVLLATRLATDTDWFVGDIGGYAKYMENWPITVVQAPPNSSEDFHRDIVAQFKVSERGAYAVVQPRKMRKSTVA